MMSLYDDAIAAWQASQSGRESEARQVLEDTLAPEDVTGLTVADVEVGPSHVRYVFTDGYLFLAVVLREPGSTVHLVIGQPGEWTNLAVVDSLAGLGKVLPGNVPPPDDPEGPDAWAPGVAYVVGDKVVYGGRTYACLQAHRSQADWTPSAVPALWGVAA